MGVCFTVILGIDPGRDKTGWALAASDGNLIRSGIFSMCDVDAFLKILKYPVDQWEKKIDVWVCERQFPIDGSLEYIALGNGTGSREMMLRLVEFEWETILVNEKGTTLAARELYWRFHRPVLWRRCLPRSLWIPPRSVDDMAAWEIVLRSFAMPRVAQGEVSTELTSDKSGSKTNSFGQ
jgi:hypothetical protein